MIQQVNATKVEGGLYMKMRSISCEKLQQYQNYLFESEYSERTIEKYMHDLRVFYEQISYSENVTKGQIIQWKNSLIQEGLAVATINSMLAAVNGLTRFLGWRDMYVKPLKQQRKLFRDKEKELSREEYMRLLKTAKQKNQHRLMLVMETICATGIRVSELQHITKEAVANGQAVVRCKGKCRVILIPSQLSTKLKAYCRKHGITSGCIFLSRNGRPLNRSNIWADMKRLCEAAGVQRQKVFPHNLRHLFARLFYQLEKDIAKLADILGHSSVETTRIYIMESGQEHERMLSRLRLVL